MCYDCCKELKGWCKSFTRTESWLTLLEAILLVLFILLLVFLIVHIVVCQQTVVFISTTTSQPNRTTTSNSTPHTTSWITVGTDVKCTWHVSSKTSAYTHYYDGGQSNQTSPITVSTGVSQDGNKSTTVPTPTKSVFENDTTVSDGVEADEYNNITVALVRVRPSREITFGCFATVVAEFWAITAASCVEAAEEVDVLEAFVLLERYGSGEPGRSHALADAQEHPRYRSGHASRHVTYDLSALRSEDSLLQDGLRPVEFAQTIDYHLVTLGETLTILGYGKFRTVEQGGVETRRLRKAAVSRLPGGACGGGAGGGEVNIARHLSPTGAAGHSACGAGAVCAGVLWSRRVPCNYCSGTPLLLPGGALLGLMADGGAGGCGAACEPALYVNIAELRDWLDIVVASD